MKKQKRKEEEEEEGTIDVDFGLKYAILHIDGLKEGILGIFLLAWIGLDSPIQDGGKSMI